MLSSPVMTFKRNMGSFITFSFSSWQIATRLSFWSWVNTLGTNFAATDACSAVLWEFADRIHNQLQPLHRDRVWYDDDPGCPAARTCSNFEGVVAVLGRPDQSSLAVEVLTFLKRPNHSKVQLWLKHKSPKACFNILKVSLPVLPNLTQNLMHTLCSSTSATADIRKSQTADAIHT